MAKKMGSKVQELLESGEFVAPKRRGLMTPAKSVRLCRELMGLSQSELARLTGIPQSTISGIESGRINLGVERAKVLARALKVHPAVLVFPGWNTEDESAA